MGDDRDRISGNTGSLTLVMLASAVGAALVLGALWLFDAGGSEPSVAQGQATAWSVAADVTSETEVEAEVYLEAWRRAHDAEVVVEGRYGLLTDERTGAILVLGAGSVGVHRARSGADAIDQLGRQVTLTDAEGTRACSVGGDGELFCGLASPGVGAEAMVDALRSRFVSEAATGDYVVFEEDAPPEVSVDAIDGVDGLHCLSLLAVRAVPLSKWGQRTTECFDDATGARVFSLTRTGDEVRLFMASEVRTSVTEEDLLPVADFGN